MRDSARGHGYPAVKQVLRDVRDTLVLRVAQGAHPGDDIEAKLVPLNLSPFVGDQSGQNT